MHNFLNTWNYGIWIESYMKYVIDKQMFNEINYFSFVESYSKDYTIK